MKTDRLREALTTPGAVNIRNDMLRAHRGKRILLSIDDFDVFKGIELKLKSLSDVVEGTSASWLNLSYCYRFVTWRERKTKTWIICERKCTGW